MQGTPLSAAGMLVVLASLCASPLTVSAQGAQGVSAGAALFGSRCAACHSVDANRVGPMLGGVVGRKVASAAGYDYSDALKRVRGRWDARRLEAWLTDPQSVAPGTRMAFSLATATDRDAVIQYLASTTPRPAAAKR
jgi:cytochrome c